MAEPVTTIINVMTNMLVARITMIMHTMVTQERGVNKVKRKGRGC